MRLGVYWNSISPREVALAAHVIAVQHQEFLLFFEEVECGWLSSVPPPPQAVPAGVHHCTLQPGSEDTMASVIDAVMADARSRELDMVVLSHQSAWILDPEKLATLLHAPSVAQRAGFASRWYCRRPRNEL